MREAAIVPLPPIVPVLCFVDGEWPLLFPPDILRGVRLDTAKSIEITARSYAHVTAEMKLDAAEQSELMLDG